LWALKLLAIPHPSVRLYFSVFCMQRVWQLPWLGKE
jgi:hypothetical protein